MWGLVPALYGLGSPHAKVSLFVCVTTRGASASQVVMVVKNPPANAGDTGDAGSIPGSERSFGEGNGIPLQYSCLDNPMDRGAWWATVHRVAKSWTRLSNLVHMQGFRGFWDSGGPCGESWGQGQGSSAEQTGFCCSSAVHRPQVSAASKMTTCFSSSWVRGSSGLLLLQVLGPHLSATGLP